MLASQMSELMMVDIYVSGYYVPRTELSLLSSFRKTYKAGAIRIPILELKKLRLRGYKRKKR